MTENAVIFAVSGAVIGLAIGELMRFGRRVFTAASKLTDTLNKAVQTAQAFEGDFREIRNWLTQWNPTPPATEPQGWEAVGGANTPPTPRAPAGFPPPDYRMYAVKPEEPEQDAEVETGDTTGNETDVLEADLHEKLRESGIEINPPAEPPPGRMVEAE